MLKILFLGTNTGVEDLILKCRKRGLYTIVTDNVDICCSPVKQMADEYWMISNRDIVSLEEQIRLYPVDAIFAGISEAALDVALELSKRFGLPFYANEDGWSIARDKSLFKDMCIRNGVISPKGYSFDIQDDSVDIEYPVIVKPVDAAACRGISICANKSELCRGVIEARAFSNKKQVIIEQFIDGIEYIAFYYMSNGKATFVNLGRVIHNSLGKPAGVYIDRRDFVVFSNTNDTIVQMLEHEPFCNGPVFIQLIKKNELFYAFEMGYRVPAICMYKLEEYLWNCDMLDLTLDFIQNVRVNTNVFNYNCISEYYAMVLVWGKGGTVYGIEGWDSVLALTNVLWGKCLVSIGKTIPDNGTLQQSVAYILCKGRTREELDDTIEQVMKCFKIIDELGNNMVLDIVL